MRSRAANEAAETDDRIVPAAFSRVLGGDRNLEGARHTHHGHVARIDVRRRERRDRAFQQPLGDEVVVFRHDDGEAEPGAGLCAFNHDHRSVEASRAYLPLNSALRFSRNARMPSRMSSVEATSPNSVASNTHASANGISRPLLIALMM